VKMKLFESAAALAPFFGARAAKTPAASATAEKRAAEGDPKDPEAEGEEDPKAKEAEGEEDKAKAEGEEDPKAEGEEDPKAEGEDPEAEDEEDPAMNTKAAMAARQYERKRIGAILGHGNAAAHPGVAMQLAFQTNVSAKMAGAVLAGAGAGAPAKNGLADRMAGLSVPRPGPGAPPAASGSAAVQGGWDAAYKRVGAF